MVSVKSAAAIRFRKCADSCFSAAQDFGATVYIYACVFSEECLARGWTVTAPTTLSTSTMGGTGKSVRCVRQTSKETNGPSLNLIQVGLPHQRSPHAVKFEDRSQEKTERLERCARGDGNLPRISTSSKKRTKLHSFHLLMSCVCLPRPQENLRKKVSGGLRSKHAYGQQGRP